MTNEGMTITGTAPAESMHHRGTGLQADGFGSFWDADIAITFAIGKKSTKPTPAGDNAKSAAPEE